MRYCFAFLMTVWIPIAASARPVSYEGGKMVMTENNFESHALHLLYSPTAKTAFGVATEYWRDKDWWYQGLQFNGLLKRWNAPDSQANVYMLSSLGVASGNNDVGKNIHEPAGFAGVELDWENRRFFTMYENHAVEAGDIDRFFEQKARVGVAPYIGEYGDLHTWLMFEVEHQPSDTHHFTYTPLIRMFYHQHLAEAGISNRGDVLFNYTVQF